MKPKKYEEPEYIAIKEKNKLLKDLIIAILLIFITLQVGIITKLTVEIIKINQENQDLQELLEMKDSMIADIQEDNIKLQEMIK